MTIRIGQGFDVHRWIGGRPFLLGGITIPHPLGLLGHSDADVLLHAVIDALLGAAALRDIGFHFPDTDPQWQGSDSRQLLHHAYAAVRKEGWRLINADTTIILERPKLAPHIPSIRESIATVMGVSSAQINVKAKTTEGLGFTGRDEGVAAMAVVLLEYSSAASSIHHPHHNK